MSKDALYDESRVRAHRDFGGWRHRPGIPSSYTRHKAVAHSENERRAAELRDKLANMTFAEWRSIDAMCAVGIAGLLPRNAERWLR